MKCIDRLRQNGARNREVARERGHELLHNRDNEDEKFDSPEFKSADVAIEFTSPHSALHIIGSFCCRHSRGIGTTGWRNSWMR